VLQVNSNSLSIVPPLVAGLICGVLDGISAIIVTALLGGKTIPMFQRIASGILGPSASQGGAKTAAFGVALHFTIAMGAAIVYYAVSRFMPFLIDQALVAGVLYGIAVHAFMQFVVLPLSAIGRRPLVMKNFIAILIVHIIVVGPSIALPIRRFSK
jgi:hypothetical protein